MCSVLAAVSSQELLLVGLQGIYGVPGIETRLKMDVKQIPYLLYDLSNSINRGISRELFVMLKKLCNFFFDKDL